MIIDSEDEIEWGELFPQNEWGGVEENEIWQIGL
jgi:hypothetical protein